MLLAALIALAMLLVWFAIRAYGRRRATEAQWRVVTRTLPDGTRHVMLSGPGGERVIRELPAALDGVALEDELAEARARAFGEALRLNELLGPRAPAARTRS